MIMEKDTPECAPIEKESSVLDRKIKHFLERLEFLLKR